MFLSTRFCCASQCVQVLVTEVAVHSIAGTEISSFISLVTGALQGDGRRSSSGADCKLRRQEEEEEELMAGVATRYNCRGSPLL